MRYEENEEREVDTRSHGTEGGMRDFAHAMGGLLIGMMIVQRRGTTTENKPEAAANPFVKYRFNCWLCAGETHFDAMPHPAQAQVCESDCKWCGIANRIEIQPAPPQV